MERAVALVAHVASLIPTPGDTLCSDDAAWGAFGELLDEAAVLVVSAIGDSSAPLLRSLITSSLGQDAVPRLLMEHALEMLTDRTRRG